MPKPMYEPRCYLDKVWGLRTQSFKSLCWVKGVLTTWINFQRLPTSNPPVVKFILNYADFLIQFISLLDLFSLLCTSTVCFVLSVQYSVLQSAAAEKKFKRSSSLALPMARRRLAKVSNTDKFMKAFMIKCDCSNFVENMLSFPHIPISETGITVIQYLFLWNNQASTVYVCVTSHTRTSLRLSDRSVPNLASGRRFLAAVPTNTWN